MPEGEGTAVGLASVGSGATVGPAVGSAGAGLLQAVKKDPITRAIINKAENRFIF